MGLLFGAERRSLTPTFPEPPIPPYPGAPTSSGATRTVSSDQALTISTVWACVGLLSNTISMFPLETFRRTTGVPVRIADPQLVATPAAGMTQSEWLHSVMVSLLLRGNAFGKIAQRDSMLRPTQIELLNPDQVRVDVDRDTGEITYKLGSKATPTPASDIWHVRGLTLPGSKVGLSPIGYAAATLGVNLSSRKFADDFFDGGGIPKAIVKSQHEVNQKQARTVKDRLLAATRNREPIVLGDGLEYVPIQVKPEESQFLATQQASIADIARYFWISPEMVGGSSGAGSGSITYANREQRAIDFLTFAVNFWMKRLEDAFFPLLPQPQYVRFNPAVLLRTDAETQAKVDVQLIAGKIKVPSEVRASRDLPPMTEAQKAEADMVPLTITPLGGAKALPALKAPPGPTAPVPAGDQQGDVNA